MPVTLTPSQNTQKEPQKIRYKPSQRVIWTDKIAKWTISSFGIFVLLAVGLILIFVGKEAAPLFFAPTSKEQPTIKLAQVPNNSSFLSWNVDEFQTYSYGIASDGHVYFISNKNGSIQHDFPIADLLKDSPAAISTTRKGDVIVVASASGKLKVLQILFQLTYEPSGAPIVTPSIEESPFLALSQNPKEKLNVQRLFVTQNQSSGVLSIAASTDQKNLWTGSYNPESKSLDLKQINNTTVEGQITGLTLDQDLRFASVTTDKNWLYRWDLTSSYDAPIEKLQPSTSGSYVSSFGLLLGDSTYILGFADGSVEAWLGVRKNSDEEALALKKIRSFEKHASKVVSIIPSGVDRSFWTFDDHGVLKMHFNPSARKLYSFDLKQPIIQASPNAHLSGMSVLTADSNLHQWELHNPHPDINWKTLFGKIWYEGYQDPEYIWQSSSGSDNFEAKFSLVPLTIGTLKGAFYGLVFAIPLSVLAAIYTSQLMSPKLRSVVKPGIEIMAALPSVIIGFLAGLWIAPLLEKHLVSFLALAPTFILFVIITASCYFRLPINIRGRISQTTELGIIMATLFLSLMVCEFLSSPIENFFFKGNIQQWIFDTTGESVEQRNSIVIGIAMGFAVIPIIFSISEDALSNVPRHYVSGSLALGATRWQSAIRVVLPTASPGIFSAIMLGFGRAVGETMIVLMATGNTPIMSFSPFNGMRTLSANIAVEIPEAPYEGSLYRVLFLGAVLLFLVTFIVNTAAEIIRMRLRTKYRAL